MFSIKAELAERNYKYADMAKEVGIPVPSFYSKLKRNHFTLAEAEKVMNLLGKRIVLMPK